MDRKYKVGGYVKLAKLWERSKDAAVAYHSSYYAEKFRDQVFPYLSLPMCQGKYLFCQSHCKELMPDEP